MRAALIVGACLGFLISFYLMTGNLIAAGIFMGGLSTFTLGVAIGSSARARPGHAPITRNRGFDCGECSETGCWSVYCPKRKA